MTGYTQPITSDDTCLQSVVTAQKNTNMSENVGQTTQLLGWLERMQRGDGAARDAMIRHMCARLELLTRTMLKGYPGVGRWVETGDILQSAVMRLLRALQTT